MDVGLLIKSMTLFPAQLRASVQGLPDELWQWKPDPRTWSILEIVAHLADEEVEDFRTRLAATLERGPFPPGIDPEGWAAERRYNEMDPRLALRRFLEERDRSLDWLRSIVPPATDREPDWSLRLEHPDFSPPSAGDLLAAWAAHDLLHLRQITRRRYEIVQRAASPHRTDYAGTWGRETADEP